MTPPPIRYPVFWLAGGIALLLLAWQGAAAIARVRSGIASRWDRLVEGPPVPSSNEPAVVAGPVVRRVLVLRDGVEAAETPGGRAVETIRRRMFADVYDVWPLRGEPTHYRIGNRRPFGWVPAADVLAWDTRLVARPSTAGWSVSATPEGDKPGHVSAVVGLSPVVAWTDRAVQVAVWRTGSPWEEIDRRGWVPLTELPDDSWGVLLSREELLDLIGRLIRPPGDEPPEGVRLRALLGRFRDDWKPTAADVEAARKVLPARAFRPGAGSRKEAGERLARLNETWNPDASWAGFGFRAIPLEALP